MVRKSSLWCSGRRRLPLPPVVAGLERNYHIIVQFEKSEIKIRLPQCVNTKSIKNSLNKVLTSASFPARYSSYIQYQTTRNLLIFLVQHTAENISTVLPVMKRVPVGLNLSCFFLYQDDKHIKVLVSQLPFTPLSTDVFMNY